MMKKTPTVWRRNRRARWLPFESHLPIGTFRRTLHPLPKRGEHVLILEKNSNGAGKRIPDDSFDVVSSVSFQHSSEKIAELPPLGQALRVQCIRAIGRIEGDPEEDEPLPVGGGYFASFEPARNVGLRCVNPYMVSSRIGRPCLSATGTGLLSYIRPVDQGRCPCGLDEMRAYRPYRPIGVVMRLRISQGCDTPV